MTLTLSLTMVEVLVLECFDFSWSISVVIFQVLMICWAAIMWNVVILLI